MLFASRRTGVYEDAIVDLVLEEDGYRLLDNYQDIQRGDIVVYRMGRTLLHGGLVVGVRPAQPMPMIKVLSKWNIGAGEDFHDVGDFHTFWAGCAWEVWTDRPLAEDANVRPIVLG